MKSELNLLSNRITNVEGLLHTSRAKERRSTSQVKAVDSQRRGVVGHLQTLRLKMPDFRARVATDIAYGFTEFGPRRIAFTSSLMVAHQRRTDNTMNEAMAPLREILEEVEVEWADTAPSIGNSSTDDQYFWFLLLFEALYCLTRTNLQEQRIICTVDCNIC